MKIGGKINRRRNWTRVINLSIAFLFSLLWFQRRFSTKMSNILETFVLRIILVLKFKAGIKWKSEIYYDSKVIPKVSGTILTLSAPGMISLSIDLSRIQGKGFRVAVWGQPVFTRDCGEEAARWLSRFLLQEDTGFRLVYYPLDYPTREIRKSNRQWLLTPDDTVSFVNRIL